MNIWVENGMEINGGEWEEDLHVLLLCKNENKKSPPTKTIFSTMGNWTNNSNSFLSPSLHISIH
jgi:hypothetical protein